MPPSRSPGEVAVILFGWPHGTFRAASAAGATLEISVLKLATINRQLDLRGKPAAEAEAKPPAVAEAKKSAGAAEGGGGGGSAASFSPAAGGKAPRGEKAASSVAR